MTAATPNNKSHNTLLECVNKVLLAYSDKDWNYSRITLIERPLEVMTSPYVLGLEILDLTTKQGRVDLKALSDEVKWGERHSSELGVLEIVSLRINRALLEATSDEHWDFKRPVARIAKREAMLAQGITSSFWYEVREVAGEDFDNR
jgi:hypothetical protein